MQASCFKDVAGIEESTLVHDHVSEFKYLGLILFLFRFVVNIKVLWFWFSPARKNASFEPLLQSRCHMAHTFGRRLCRWTLWLFALKTCLRLLGSLVNFWRSGDKDTHEMPWKEHLNTSYGQRGVSLPKSKATCLDFFASWRIKWCLGVLLVSLKRASSLSIYATWSDEWYFAPPRLLIESETVLSLSHVSFSIRDPSPQADRFAQSMNDICHLVGKLPSELLSLLLGSSPCPCIGTVTQMPYFLHVVHGFHWLISHQHPR